MAKIKSVLLLAAGTVLMVSQVSMGVDKKVFRASDDGEPSNSSGPPILGQIRSYDLLQAMDRS